MASTPDLGKRIQDLDIATELKQSYLRYAMSVIVDRALPDVRDGLKPSQRRILVAMNDLGLVPTRKTLKCAKVVGETMGNYHPHGDQAIYPTLVRLAQDFNMRVRLIQGQGNFGNIDGDPPAAQRYTECRMTHAATDLLADIDKDTVDFQPNYDESRVEPVVLPGRFPNLLINGGSGIAVAMASSIPPHNPTEVANAVDAYLDNPEITLPELMEIIPGPDLPTGARICGQNAIRQAYATGRGVLEMRAKHTIEEDTRGASRIVITEIPYQVNKQNLIKKIADLARTDRVVGITDIRDLSAEDIRIEIKVKRGEDPEIVLNNLHRYSQLRDSLSVIMIALVDGRPVTCSLKRLIEEFVRHRRIVIRRRTQYLLRKAEERDHIVIGMLKALDLIDEIVALIRASHDPKEAKRGLIERFEFTTVQADAILQMRLQRLTGLQRLELEKEHEQLQEAITDYRAILADEERITQIIRDDMTELRERHGSERGTVIEDSQEELTSLDFIAPENVVVTLSHEGYIKRTELDAYRKQRRGGKGIIGNQSKEGDFVEQLLVANTHDELFCFTDSGRVFKKGVYQLPDLGRYAKGRAVVNFLELQDDERLHSILPTRETEEGASILFATRAGVVKRTRLSDFKNIHRGGIIALQLRPDDSLIGTRLVHDEDHVVLVTAHGMTIRFPVSDVRAMGRTATGVRGIQLRGDDHVVAMVHVDPDAALLTVCEKGYAKRTAFSEYRVQSRGGLGLRNLSQQGLKRNGPVVDGRTVLTGDEIILITEGGQTIRMQVSDDQFRLMGRSTAGVRAINIPAGDRLVSMAWVRPEDEGAEDGGDVADGTSGAEADPDAQSGGDADTSDE